MESNNNNQEKTGIFNLLYRTRIQILKGDSIIINLSVLFSVIALLCAPWLVIIGAIVALVLGYRFSVERNAAGFSKDFEHVVKDAADNVKNVVDNVTKKAESTHENETHGGDSDSGDDYDA